MAEEEALNKRAEIAALEEQIRAKQKELGVAMKQDQQEREEKQRMELGNRKTGMQYHKDRLKEIRKYVSANPHRLEAMQDVNLRGEAPWSILYYFEAMDEKYMNEINTLKREVEEIKRKI